MPLRSRKRICCDSKGSQGPAIIIPAIQTMEPRILLRSFLLLSLRLAIALLSLHLAIYLLSLRLAISLTPGVFISQAMFWFVWFGLSRYSADNRDDLDAWLDSAEVDTKFAAKLKAKAKDEEEVFQDL
ncbi:hypothetical protein FCM35_KLT09443 [Carex littledalei]|uniref:Uncharacterized protein n=1 Tax=Carex littledalei TaxID=544730 RepID=A0A833RG06_9POAL|nr:hypothetical protein FCM35_KLT09443 [Carex littledalei]